MSPHRLRSCVTRAYRSPTHFICCTFFVSSQYYSLKQLVYLLAHADATMASYISACTQNNVKWVATIEKADVLAYLRGQTDDAAQVRCREPTVL